MDQCENACDCTYFFVLERDDSAMANLMRMRYCYGGSESCARLKAAREFGPGNVPADLMPHQLERVETVLAES